MLVSRFCHDDLGMMPAFHMLGLRDSLRRDRLRVRQDLVLHFVFIQTIDQSFWYFHNRLRLGKYHLPGAISTVRICCPCKGSRQLPVQLIDQMNTPRTLTVRERLMLWLHAKFAKMNMTRRLKWSLVESATRSTASSARSTRWLRFARTATAGLSGMALKPTDKSSAASTARAPRAKRN